MSNLKLIEIADLAVEKCLDGDKLDMPKFVQVYGEMLVNKCADIPTIMWDENQVNADVAVKIRNRILNTFEIEDDTR